MLSVCMADVFLLKQGNRMSCFCGIISSNVLKGMLVEYVCFYVFLLKQGNRMLCFYGIISSNMLVGMLVEYVCFYIFLLKLV